MVNSLIYILATLGANYTAAWFLPLPVFGHISVGTFIFGVTFTQRDRIHHRGRRWVYGTIAAACLANVVMSAALGVPPRIILASFVAIALAEGVDTEIYQALRHQSWLARVAASNAVSVPIDTLIFTAIAFGGVLSPSKFVSLLFGEVLVKWAVAFGCALYRPKPTRQNPTTTH
jgi:queuosine precursor transporter